ncbi:MAG: hypothetical protein AMS16_06295 [Planctomycetes bacterium DG_58]|nr:MAG: hypothetical protein AMS16_06295 [Planctomycetes bacterium DG_58]
MGPITFPLRAGSAGRTGKEETVKKRMMCVTVALCFLGSAFAAHGVEGVPQGGKPREEPKGARGKPGGILESYWKDRSRGQVKSIDLKGGKLVLTIFTRNVGPSDKTFLINAETKVELLGVGERTLADIDVGRSVVIRYKEDNEKGRNPTALTITIQLSSTRVTVKSVDVEGGRLVVTGRGGAMNFVVTDETKVRIDGEEKTLAYLAPKDVVTLYFKGDRREPGRMPRTDREPGQTTRTALGIKIQMPWTAGAVRRINVRAGKIVVAVRKRGKREPIELTFAVDDATKIFIGADEKALGDLAPKDFVMVYHKRAEKPGDDPIAASIRLEKRPRPR